MDRKKQKLSLGKNEVETQCQEEEMTILKQKLINMEDVLKLKNEERDHLVKRVTSLEQEVVKKEAQLRLKNEEQEYLLKRITSLEQEVAKKETQIKLKVEEEHLAKSVISLEQQLAEKETQLNLKNEEQEHLRKRVISLEQELERKEAQLQVIKEPFNVFPNEVILEIFKHLPQNKLGKFARVCKRWNGLTRSPVLWQKVNVKFHCRRRHKSQNAIFNFFIDRLPCSATSVKFNFVQAVNWDEPLDFNELCVTLQGKCPQLNELILHQSRLTISLSSAVDLCSQLLPNVTTLVLTFSEFLDCPEEVQYTGASKIAVLDVSGLGGIEILSKTLFSRMLCLKELHLRSTDINDSWFKNRISFLNRIEVLDIGGSRAGSGAVRAIKKHAHNLKELYLCITELGDEDFRFDISTFPQLNTICLNQCSCVSCEGIVSLVQSCPSLVNIYVGRNVALVYAKHPFIIANQCKLGIVKTIECYKHYKKYYTPSRLDDYV